MIPINPIPSLRQVGVRARLAGAPLRVAPLPASAWLEAIFTGGIGGVLGLCDDSDAIEDAIADGHLRGGALGKVLNEMLAAAAGRPWRVALMLIILAQERWATTGGELMRLGFKVDEMPLGAFLDAIYTVATRNMKPEEVAKFDAVLMGADAPSARGMGRPAPSPVPATAAPFVMTRSRTRTRPIPRPPDGPTAPPTPPPARPARSAPAATTARRPATD